MKTISLEKILDGLGDEYKELVRTVQARDTTISFDELHEKLLNFETTLPGTKPEPNHFTVSANPANRNNSSWRSSNNSGNNGNHWRPSNTLGNNGNHWRPPPNSGNNSTGWCPSPNYNNYSPISYNAGSNSGRNDRPPHCPYLGHCQICGIQEHTAKKCPSFRLIPVQSSA
ncbi:hypothetical protein JRO89_XS03G0297100 [Xanthoceras sorbifolium]|uniref:CCHC-type domain-containing protein n=1 Tax=Xanthoceras sorbifolium TaxID=99658 RepID=A0ABQ8ICR7_9ROSI|nr:hypothetical protein JRO89_XS03G0297100 [Xanthoceras sorbifolium]